MAYDQGMKKTAQEPAVIHVTSKIRPSGIFRHRVYCGVLGLMMASMTMASEEITPEQALAGMSSLTVEARDGGGECYIVCIYETRIDPHGISFLAVQGKFEIAIKSVIVDVLKGGRKKGEPLEFFRYAGDEEGTKEVAAWMRGKLFFVQREVVDGGGLIVCPQTPNSVIPYSEKTEKIFKDFFGK